MDALTPKIGVQRFLYFEKYSKMKILVFEIFEKGQIFRPSTLKTDFFFQKDSIIAYVHIEYSTYKFLGESKGVGLIQPPPLSGP